MAGRRPKVRWNESAQRWIAFVRFPDGSRRKVERVDQDDAEGDLEELLTLQAAEQGVSLNRLLLGYLSDIARINRHLTAKGQQQADSSAQVLRRSKQGHKSLSPSRQEIVDTLRNLRGADQ